MLARNTISGTPKSSLCSKDTGVASHVTRPSLPQLLPEVSSTTIQNLPDSESSGKPSYLVDEALDQLVSPRGELWLGSGLVLHESL